MTFIRTFISVELPENTIKEVNKIQEQLPEFKGKKTEAENLHLTLKFLGNIDEETLGSVKERLGQIKFKKFKTEISEIGIFSPENVRIIWVKLEDCMDLQKEIDEILFGLFEKEKRFMGHVTIARVKSLRNKKEFLEEIGKINLPEIKFMVKNFKLKKSTLGQKGPVYETLEEYNLV